MPSKINVFRFSEALRREFGLVAGITPQLDETIAPVVLVADLSPEGGKIAAFGQYMGAGGAGVYGAFGIYNGGASGKLVRVQRLLISSSTSQIIYIGIFQALYGTPVQANWRDWREPGFPSTQFYTFAGGAIAPVRRLAQFNISTNVPVDLPYEAILPPGTGLEVTQSTDNLSWAGNVLWSEEPLIPAG